MFLLAYSACFSLTWLSMKILSSTFLYLLAHSQLKEYEEADELKAEILIIRHSGCHSVVGATIFVKL